MAMELGGEKVACDMPRRASLRRPSRAAQHCVEADRRTGPPLRICRCNGETVRNRLGGKADFSYWQCYEGPVGPIAQLDRVTDFYSVGCRFESCWDRQPDKAKNPNKQGLLSLCAAKPIHGLIRTE